MTTIDGTAHSGLAVICLEPENPYDFIVYDTLICEGNEVVYTIPPAKYAEGIPLDVFWLWSEIPNCWNSGCF